MDVAKGDHPGIVCADVIALNDVIGSRRESTVIYCHTVAVNVVTCLTRRTGDDISFSCSRAADDVTRAPKNHHAVVQIANSRIARRISADHVTGDCATGCT